MYVDFISMTGNNEIYIVSIKKEPRNGFEMIDLGHLHYYLGIEVTQNTKYIFISLNKYTRELLNMFDTRECSLYSNGTKYGAHIKRDIEFEVETKYI